MSDYKVVFNEDSEYPNKWEVLDDDLVFDRYATEDEAKEFIHELEQTAQFCHQVQMSVEAFATIMDIQPIEFIHMVENHQTRTLRGLWAL